jgi:hypothetical protein
MNMEVYMDTNRPRDADNWARHGHVLAVNNHAAGVSGLNVRGRAVVGPLQGFGQLWQKTYRLDLVGCEASPQEVVAIWKAHFPEFQPPDNRFFPSLAGVTPGEVVLINASLQGIPIQTGVMVLYADDLSFTLMTPQGHPESGWVTFSCQQANGTTTAIVQSIARANDPIYELGFLLGGSQAQEMIWKTVLTNLARALHVVPGTVVLEKQCVDTRLQWNQWANIWQNAVIRSAMFALTKPFRL